MQTWLGKNSKFALLIGLASLAACANGIQDPNKIPLQGIDTIKILSYDPQPNSTGVPLDKEITITFDRQVDPYSAHPSNFEIVSASGARMPLDGYPSTQFIPDPRDSNKMVSIISLRTQKYFMPNTKYHVLIREAFPDDQANRMEAALAGVRSIDGAILGKDSFSFVTGEDFSDFKRTRLTVLGMSPGRLFGSNETAGQDKSFSNVLDSYTSFSKKSPIRITFSEPFRHLVHDAPHGPYNDIPPTPLNPDDSNDSWRGLLVGLIDKDTPLDQFAQSIPDAINNPDRWQNFIDTNFYGRLLRGKIHTENHRRVLAFELDDRCTPASECEYPDSTLQAVVVIIQGVVGADTRKPLNDAGMVVGGFLNFSGIELGQGFPRLSEILSGGGS